MDPLLNVKGFLILYVSNTFFYNFSFLLFSSKHNIMSRYLLGLLASFFLFASFILGLFILIGQLSNKPFINIISFVHALSPQYDLSYDFGLWQVCFYITSFFI